MSESIVENKDIPKPKESESEDEEKKVLELRETGDYPFKSWVTFFAAFTEGLVSEDFEEEYPRYNRILDKYSNCTLINTMMKKYGCDPNEGLYLYIRALCYDGTRYARYGYDKSMINLFIKKGAEFPVNLLFDSEPEIFNYDIEEEFDTYDIRTMILDDFGEKLNLDVSKYADWKNIEAKDFRKVKISQEEANDEDFIKNLRMQYLKYLSKYLHKISN